MLLFMLAFLRSDTAGYSLHLSVLRSLPFFVTTAAATGAIIVAIIVAVTVAANWPARI